MERSRIIMFTMGIVLTGIVWYTKYENKRRSSSKVKSKVFFSSEESAECKSHLKTGKSCNRLHCPVRTLNEIKGVMASAKESLDVCVYFLSNPSLLETIIEVFNRNVTVRIITDADMSDNTASIDHIMRLRKHGIKVRCRKSEFYMHHKFAVVDRQILITGSVNWTHGGFFGNYENIIVSNHPDLTGPFTEEFDRMWKIFDTFEKTPISRVRK